MEQRSRIRIEARADVGDVEEHEVEPRELVRRGAHAFAVQRDDVKSRARIRAIEHGRAIGRRGIESVLGPEEAHEGYACALERHARVHGVVGREARGVVGDEADGARTAQERDVRHHTVHAEPHRHATRWLLSGSS